MSNVVSNEELQELSGLKKPSSIERWLEEQNIRYLNGKNGPWTTIGLIEASKGLVNGHDLASNDNKSEDIL